MTWIPLTIFAAFAQTIRNAAQRQLVAELGTLGATFVRFLYGLPFAAAWLAGVLGFTALPAPAVSVTFIGWTLLGGVSQIAGHGADASHDGGPQLRRRRGLLEDRGRATRGLLDDPVR